MQDERCRILSVQASAGSGKTHSLAKRYINLLLSKSEEKVSLKNVIAVTFANKAAIEMKYRVMEYLKKAALGLDAKDIFSAADKKTLPLKSKKILDEILNRYDDFNISTIDSFINRILKACAVNTGLSPNFRVEKEHSKHLAFALDSFLQSASSSLRLKELLCEYVAQYTLSEKSGWFPANDIYNEIEKVFKKSSNSGKEIAAGAAKFGEEIKRRASRVFLSAEKFYSKFSQTEIYSNYIKALEKVLSEGEKVFYNPSGIPKAFANESLKYKKGARNVPEADVLWAEMNKEVRELCGFYSENYYGVYSNIYSKVQSEFEARAKKDELVFLNGINKKALELFVGKSAVLPEVYYRLSERYKHFLIDEFQDTSPVQWAGIRRFLEESLASGGTFFYVGDPKQAIYDFRGGNSEIFYKIPDEFHGIFCDIVMLKENYRSFERIVDFNNKLFSAQNIERYLKEVYEDKEDFEGYKTLLSVYERSFQNVSEGKAGGYVNIEILPEDVDDEEELLKEKFLALVSDVLERFKPNDAAVLCRTNNEARLASGWLLEKGIPAHSLQTLNIKNNPVVKQILSLMMFIDSPMDSLAFASFITGEIFSEISGVKTGVFEDFLFKNSKKRDSEVFYKEFEKRFGNLWEEYFEYFFVRAGRTPVYELALEIISKFKIAGQRPFVIRFLELIKDFEEEDGGIKNFIEYFNALEDNDESLYIKSVSGAGVKVMTVHSAKGLQFPVVMLPFLKLSERAVEKPYFDDSGEKIGLSLISKKLSDFSGEIKSVYEKEKAKSLFSEMNVLYVSLTRAERELYALVPSKDGSSNNTLPNLLGAKLFGRKNFSSGEKGRGVESSAGADYVFDGAETPYTVSQKYVKPSEDLDLSESKRRGTMMHFALSRITSLKGKDLSAEIKKAVSAAQRKFLYDDVSWISGELNAFFLSEEIKAFFTHDEDKIFNEKEVVALSGESFRMDKLIISENEAIVVDFKSSARAFEENIAQVKNYLSCVRELYPGKKARGFIVDVKDKKITEI